MGELYNRAKELGITGPDGSVAWFWVPGEYRWSKILPPDSPAPSSKAVWPLPKRYGQKVSRYIAGSGPDSQRCIGYKRPIGSNNRAHAGIDLYAPEGASVYAVDDGKIIRFTYFTTNVFALLVDHGSYVVNYGEVAEHSLRVFSLQANKYNTRKGEPAMNGSGSTVKAGQQIALVGKMHRSSMLHFEMWAPGTWISTRWTGFPNGAPPSNLYNPTNFLLVLSGKQAEQQPVVKEQLIAQTCK